MTMKIGITGHGFIDWGGGLDFLRLVCESLIAADPSIELHFLFPVRGPRYHLTRHIHGTKQTLNRLLGRPYIKRKTPDIQHLTELVQSMNGKVFAHFIDNGMRALRKATQRHNLDILLPCIHPLREQCVPWIGYLYDYQHAYLPEFFTAQELAIRNGQFAAMLREASHVVVNAKAVASDIENFNPDHRAEVIALPFSAAPNPQWLTLPFADLEKYNLHHPYFIISNQFWQHKDHLTAWHALALVLRSHPDTELVCTGEPHDYRNPQHFPALMEAAEKLGITHRLRVLGLIPKSDQIALLRDAVAVLQPSLFEGGPGGGAVFDAVSLGVPAIVSSIPVNRELDEPGILFFAPHDATALAAHMVHALETRHSKTRPDADTLLAAGTVRRQRCGNHLLRTIRALTAQPPATV